MKDALNDQALVNEALCAENCVGRWVWKSGDLQNQNMVPWEVQAINTCPDNFLWEKNRAVIIMSAPGLYALSFGFYSKRSPVVNILVNNEIAITIGANSSNSSIGGGAASNRNAITTVGRHSAGNICGLTINEYVALPARARVSISFEGETLGEGFFQMRKL